MNKVNCPRKRRRDFPARAAAVLAVLTAACTVLLGLTSALAAVRPAAPRPAAAVPSPLSASTAAAWSYFTGLATLTAVQVAGLEGNLQFESGGGLDPAVVQGGCRLSTATTQHPCGVGIAQWSDPGGRFNSLNTLAQQQGVSWQTLQLQLQFVWQELTSDSAYGLATLRACTTTACATQAVEQDYERPANTSTNCSASPLPSYCQRLADANQLLSAYQSSGTPVAAQVISNPAGTGYWLLSNQGGVYSYGDAPFHGGAAGQSYFAGQTAVGLAATPDGKGYWILSAAGGIYSYGSAQFYGAAAGQSYFAGQRAVGIVTDPAGTGYWILSASGGVYSYGSATSYGSAAGQSYFAGQTAVSLVADPAGAGYWILSAAGGIYGYGNVPFYGAAAGQSYFAGQRAVGMTVNPAGTGYWILSAGGGIYGYGSAPFDGAASGQAYFSGQTATGLTSTRDGGGYFIVSAAAGVYAYGDASFAGQGV